MPTRHLPLETGRNEAYLGLTKNLEQLLGLVLRNTGRRPPVDEASVAVRYHASHRGMSEQFMTLRGNLTKR